MIEGMRLAGMPRMTTASRLAAILAADVATGHCLSNDGACGIFATKEVNDGNSIERTLCLWRYSV